MNQQDRLLEFKGMRRFRYRRNDDLLLDSKRSPYFWWWKYLRISRDYWWACHRNGSVDDLRLRSMYRDFGNVYEQSFDRWWDQRGIGLFYEQLALPEVRTLDRKRLEFSPGYREHLLLEIPLHMTEKTIIKQVRQHLRQNADRRVERFSSAVRPLAKLIGIRQDVIEIAYEVWLMHHVSRASGRTYEIGEIQGTKSLYQIGKELRLVKTCMPTATDDKERAAKRVNGMKVAVSRMLSRANNLAENAALGVFPSVQVPAEPIVWSRNQIQRMDEAINLGLWRPLFDETDVLIV